MSLLGLFAPHRGRHAHRPHKRCTNAGTATTTTDQGHPGVWPGGEPESVRRAYDALLAAQRRDDAPTTPFPRPNDTTRSAA